MMNFTLRKNPLQLSPDQNIREYEIRNFENKQIAFAGLGLFLIIAISIFANSLHLFSVAQQTTNVVSRMIQAEDFREVGMTLQETRLENFRQIEFKSQRPGRSFSLPFTINLEPQKNLWSYISTERFEFKIQNPLQSGTADSIIFEINRFRLLPYALMVWFILVIITIPQTRLMKRKLILQFEKNIILERGQVKAEIARQVRHNLRTPLAALLRIPARLPDSVKVDRDLLASSIAQIRAITSALDDGENNIIKISKATTEDIYDTLTRTLREVTLIIPRNIIFDYEIDDSIASTLVPHIPHELRAVIGNIINNSIEAIQNSAGTIKFFAKDLGPEIQITIEDSGCGILSEQINNIFENGFSFGKPSGTGIGLFHAKTWIENWNGRITIVSKPNELTSVAITLPIHDRAPWYVPRLKFSKDDIIFILDDQMSAHNLWQVRLEESKIKNQVHFASNQDEIKSILKSENFISEHSHFLFDYDIASRQTGLDILINLPKNSQRYLITGHFDQPDIRRRCSLNGFSLLPKSEIASIHIVVC